MPCYLFTCHGYGNWMPDHKKVYVHRTRGLQLADTKMANSYRANQKNLACCLILPNRRC